MHFSIATSYASASDTQFYRSNEFTSNVETGMSAGLLPRRYIKTAVKEQTTLAKSTFKCMHDGQEPLARSTGPDLFIGE